jgi:hypothetical protein
VLDYFALVNSLPDLTLIILADLVPLSSRQGVRTPKVSLASPRPKLPCFQIRSWLSEYARAKASSFDQLSAAVRAIEAKPNSGQSY